MADTTLLPKANLEAIELDVVGKFKQLHDAALGSRSFFMRAKDALKELFADDKSYGDEYSKRAGDLISETSKISTQGMMQLALEWATREKELAYTMAQSRANTELVMAQRERVGAEILSVEKETELKAANLEAVIASSIRENGRVMTYDIISGLPTELHEEGLKWSQIGSQRANTYSTLADAFRKSGVVVIGTHTDGVLKAVSGDDTGYTLTQDKFAARQLLSFEDSKRNHAANASSSMIGQMLASEIPPAAEDVARWRASVDYLNTPTAETP